MNSNTQSQSAIRKAAIVISTLDPVSANALLDKMPSDAAEQVRQMLIDLSEIPPGEQDEVLREFMSAGGLTHPDEFEGVELDPGLAEKLRSPESFSKMSPSPEQAETPSQPPFRFLQQATPDVLAKHLERQYPQVIAVVAAHLPPHQAADVIKRFKPKLQSEVLRRIAELDFADQDALRDIERELESLLSDDLRVARNRQSGLAAVSTILNAAGAQRSELFNNLSEHERDLAKHLSRASGHSPDSMRSPNMHSRGYVRQNVGAHTVASTGPRSDKRSHDSVDYPRSGERSHDSGERSPEKTFVPMGPVASGREIDFEELSLLADNDWVVLIRAAEPAHVILALTGASEQLLRRITRQLSKREAQALRDRLQVTGPLRLSDIEHAQRSISRLACQLAARGELHLPERRAFAAAA